jgi:hypothetical protein
LVSSALEAFSLQKVYDALEVEEDLFCEEELKRVLKVLKNNKTPGADSEVSDFF